MKKLPTISINDGFEIDEYLTPIWEKLVEKYPVLKNYTLLLARKECTNVFYQVDLLFRELNGDNDEHDTN